MHQKLDLTPDLFITIVMCFLLNSISPSNIKPYKHYKVNVSSDLFNFSLLDEVRFVGEDNENKNQTAKIADSHRFHSIVFPKNK